MGVPEEKDFGEHRLIVTALPFSNYSTKCPIATDTFTVEVCTILLSFLSISQE